MANLKLDKEITALLVIDHVVTRVETKPVSRVA